MDVLVVSEHWFAASVTEFLRIEDYVLGSVYGRDVACHGGVAILVDRNSRGRCLNGIVDKSVERHCEMAAYVTDSPLLYVVGVYRPPTGDFGLFLEIVAGILADLCEHKMVAIAGDFNVRFGDLEDGRANELENCMWSYGFHRVFSDPSRGANCIDNVFVNFCHDACEVRTVNVEFSDHCGQILGIPMVGRGDGGRLCNGRRCRRINADVLGRICSRMEMCDWSFVECDGLLAGDRWMQFMALFRGCVDCYAPLKTMRSLGRATGRGSLGCWFAWEFRIVRDCLRVLSAATHVFRSVTLVECRNAVRTYYRKSIRRAKRYANDQLVARSTNPGRDLWRIVNKKRRVIDHVVSDIKPETFNDYFLNVSETLLREIVASDCDPLAFSVPPSDEEFSFTSVEIFDVLEVVGQLRNSGARDCYDLDVRLLKNCILSVCDPLTSLINQVLLTGEFPDCLKVASVLPVFKKGDRSLPENYRPISLLPVFSKIIEKIMKTQLVAFFDRHGLFSERQFGFRGGRGTQDAIMSYVQGVYRDFEESRYCSTTYFDLSRAFDCVPHQILLQKLARYGLGESAVGLLGSYLADRAQFVAYGGRVSGIGEIVRGVPQGSVLGPLLFIIYVNDMPQVDVGLSYHLFADDTTVSFADCDVGSAVERESLLRTTVSSWFAANLLTANLQKTTTMILSLKCLQGFENPDYVKFLGVILDPRLNFRRHVDMVSSRISKNLFLLRRLSGVLSLHSLLIVYYGVIESHVNYAILIWGHTSWARDKIFRLQRKAIRIIFGLGYRGDCRESFIGGDILTYPSIYILRAVMFIHGDLSNRYTGAMVHGYETRGRDRLRMEYHRLDRTRDGAGYWSTRFYNCLPVAVRGWSGARLRKTLRDYLSVKCFYSFGDFIVNDFSDFN